MSYPQLFFRDQFGDPTIANILGGSGAIAINFIVDSTNGNGLGIRSLKYQGQPNIVKNVFMATSATPAAGNPNPLAGYILIQLADAYLSYIGGTSGFVSPLSGTPINISSGVTQGQAYVIVSVGNTTAVQWQAIGLPVGLIPTVGQAFIASTTGNGVGTGVVEVPATNGSGIQDIEVVGDPNQSSNPSAGNGGAWFVLQCLGGSTHVATAPADGSVIGLTFSMGGPVRQPEI